MNQNLYALVRWDHAESPTEAAITAEYERMGLPPYRWSNEPGDVYAAHAHAYTKVLYVVTGSIMFGFPTTGHEVELFPGDRLDLRPGVQHNAVVGPHGVTCLEAHRV